MCPKKQRYENFEKLPFCESVGKYKIPVIKPDNISDTDFIGFNFAKSAKDKAEKGVHFFVDDYQFTRLWQRPNDYINLLSQFRCVLTCDFSLYTDFPLALQIYNHYRKHWLGAYWQEQGLKVIPTICWSDEESFEWCFDGEPKHSTIAVSSIGTQNNKRAKEMFLKGYKEMMKRLEPERIIFYGNVPEECRENIVRIKAFQDKFREARVNGC